MYINSISNQENSLYHDTLFHIFGKGGFTDTAQYPLNDFLRSANVWYRKVNTYISEADGIWEFDDRNWSTLLSTTSDLVDTQHNYAIGENIRRIERIEVKDNEGDFYVVRPFDKSQVNVALSELYETDGFPSYYDLEGNNILLYPAPATANVTITAGLKIYFSRDISPFVIADTTTEPGFDNHFHRMISMGSAYDYCVAQGITDKQKQIMEEINQLKAEIKKHYGSRHREMKAKIIPNDQEGI